MIKATCTDGSVILGLSRENCEKLLKQCPIVIELADMGLHKQQIIIVAAETDQALARMLLTSAGSIADDFKVHRMPGDGFLGEKERN